MKVANGQVVEMEYTLRDDAGEVIDTSEGSDPLVYLHGESQIVPGLEKAITGLAVGESLKVTVSPEEGYGTLDPSQVMKVDRKQLPRDAEPEVGMQLAGMGPDGHPILLTIMAVEGSTVTLDANHPLAGKNLHFEVKIKSIREATADELEHGHVHDPNDPHHGHHH
ncbi:MAG: peptidylprolyl isomerase [Myxococcales bacterium]|nr:peptidylprolyl isomerase [Myxococcales bacterium]